MSPSLRTPEGKPQRCHVCGNEVYVEASQPAGDSVCPHCGSLLWVESLTDAVEIEQVSATGVERRLAEKGAFITVDATGEVRTLRLVGDHYSDWHVYEIARITGLELLDVRETRITARGAARLRKLMPETTILGPDL